MRNNNFFLKLIGIIFLGLFFVIKPVYAQEDDEELKKQVETLHLKVKELEKQLESKAPLPGEYPQHPFMGSGEEHWKRSQLNPWGIKDFNSNWTVDGESEDWKLFPEIKRMQKEINRMFQDSFHRRGWSSSGMLNSSIFYDEEFDLKKTEEGYVLKLDIKGLDKENINVDINENAITISGAYSQQVEETNPQGSYSLRGYGSFLKTMPLPADADTGKMETVMEEDSLIITIPRK